MLTLLLRLNLEEPSDVVLHFLPDNIIVASQSVTETARRIGVTQTTRAISATHARRTVTFDG